MLNRFIKKLAAAVRSDIRGALDVVGPAPQEIGYAVFVEHPYQAIDRDDANQAAMFQGTVLHEALKSLRVPADKASMLPNTMLAKTSDGCVRAVGQVSLDADRSAFSLLEGLKDAFCEHTAVRIFRSDEITDDDYAELGWEIRP